MPYGFFYATPYLCQDNQPLVYLCASILFAGRNSLCKLSTQRIKTMDSRVAIAQTRVILDSVKINVVASLITATAVLFILGGEQPLSFLLPWYVLFVIMTVARFYHARLVNRVDLTEHNIKQVLSQLTLLGCTAGCLWGILGFYSIDSEKLVTSVILLMIFTGLVANAAATLSPYLPLFVGFVFPTMLPAAYKFYYFGDQKFYWITGLIFVYLVVTLINVRSIRRSLKQSIELRYEILELIQGLQNNNSKTQAAFEKAESASLAKSRFFAAASHDLRQPLQSLGMFTATLALKTKEPEQKRIVSQIENSIRSLEGLFNALLDISSLDAGTLKFAKQHIRLQAYINQIVSEFTPRAVAKSLSIEVTVSDEVVYTDPILFGRILRNLIENAVRYTSSGGIVIRCEVVDDRVVLSVVDTGIGISEDMQSHVFGEFMQLNNPERDRNKGLGLGLSIVQRVCSMLDIPLTLNSVVGQGSTFAVSVERGDASLVVKDSAVEGICSEIQELFVIVIDDEEDVRLSFEGLLLAWGCTVMVASTGEEAVRQIIEYGSNPDVIISDYRLQNNETGGDAIAAVRAHCGSELPAIIVTGDIAPERLIEIDRLDMPVLHKPCSAKSLRKLLLTVT